MHLDGQPEPAHVMSRCKRETNQMRFDILGATRRLETRMFVSANSGLNVHIRKPSSDHHNVNDKVELDKTESSQGKSHLLNLLIEFMTWRQMF